MIKAIIIDDDTLSIKVLSKILDTYSSIEVLRKFTSPKNAIKYLDKNNIDLVFLDVEMPDLNGFELLDSLNKNLPRIIVVSAHENYALTAFKYNVDDYLLKPFVKEELDKSLQKVIGTNGDSFKSNDDTHLFIKDGSVIHRIDKEDVVIIECIGDYAKVIDRKDKTYIVHSTMKSLCEKFHEDQFIRVHRSYIINMNDLKDIQGNTISILNKLIPIGKTYKKSFYGLVDTI